jgi:hypothetical protein
MLLLAGVVMANGPPPPSPPFRILHRAGAIYEAGTGWNYQAFNTGILSGDWAVDFLYGPTGPSILHKYGAIWTTDGWDYGGFLAGNDYARALQALPDLSGCWCAYHGSWRIWRGNPVGIEGSPPYNIIGDHYSSGYPVLYVKITQTGTLLLVSHCSWDDDAGDYVCDDVYCTLGMTHIVCQTGGPPADPNDCSWGHELVGGYFWDPEHGGESGDFGIQLALVQSDMYCQGSGVACGEFGVITLWRSWYDYDGETWQDCVCAPGPPGP